MAGYDADIVGVASASAGGNLIVDAALAAIMDTTDPSLPPRLFAAKVERMLGRKLAIDECGMRLCSAQPTDGSASYMSRPPVKVGVPFVQSEGITFQEAYNSVKMIPLHPSVVLNWRTSNVKAAPDRVDVLIRSVYRDFSGVKFREHTHSMPEANALGELGVILRIDHSHCQSIVTEWQMSSAGLAWEIVTVPPLVVLAHIANLLVCGVTGAGAIPFAIMFGVLMVALLVGIVRCSHNDYDAEASVAMPPWRHWRAAR